MATPGRMPLRSAGLSVDAACGIARVKLEQVFENPHAEPLRVKYELPLPADAAVSGFAFRIGTRRIVGTVDEVKKARETFERAIAEGRTAALLEETRTSLFSQELGNIPPGETIVAEILIDQPLAWVDVEGAWEWRFPLTAAPRYLGAPGAGAPRDLSGHTPDGARMMLDVTEDATDTRATLALRIGDALVAGRSPESPSHPLQIDARSASGGGVCVALGGGGGAALDRDLVVRWPVALAAASLSFEATRSGGTGGEPEEICAMLTVVPPRASAARDAARVPRDLAILLDTSGSMDGEPLAQAKRIASALVASLGDADTLDMVEFSSAPRRFRRGPVRAAAAARKDALAWIAGLHASGGTEMLAGITEALAGLRPEAQRQVVVVTDGLIGFERDVVSAVQKGLPRGSRVHAVGVGSSTNRTLLSGIARVGGGVEVVVGLGEDPERAARRVLARTADPVVVDLEVEGASIVERAPGRLPDLYAGAPARIAVRLRAEGGELVVRGRAGDGDWRARVTVPPRTDLDRHDAAAKLFARERASDLEAELSAGRDKASVDRDLVALGVRHQIATRVTAWVAASEEVMVDPTAPGRRETVPQQVPFGASAAGMGLRPTAIAMDALFELGTADDDEVRSLAVAPPQMAAPMSLGAPPPAKAKSIAHPMPMSAVRRRAAALPPPATPGPAGFGGAPGGAAPPPPKAPAAPMPRSAVPASSLPASPMPASRADGGRRDDEGQEEGGALETAADRPVSASKEEARREPEAPAAPGLLGSLVRRVREIFAVDPAEEEVARAEAKGARDAASSGAAAPAVRIARGRVARIGDRELAIEIDVEGDPLDIASLVADALLVTSLGAHLSAQIRVDASTRPGVHPVGTTVRLVVVLAAPLTGEVALAFFTPSRPGAPVIRVELGSG